MGQKEKTIAAMRQNPQKVTLATLEKVLTWYQFSKRPGKGSHNIYKRQAPLQTFRFTIVKPHGRRKYVSPEAVTEVLQAIDQLEAQGLGLVD